MNTEQMVQYVVQQRCLCSQHLLALTWLWHLKLCFNICLECFSASAIHPQPIASSDFHFFPKLKELVGGRQEVTIWWRAEGSHQVVQELGVGNVLWMYTKMVPHFKSLNLVCIFVKIDYEEKQFKGSCMYIIKIIQLCVMLHTYNFKNLFLTPNLVFHKDNFSSGKQFFKLIPVFFWWFFIAHLL